MIYRRKIGKGTKKESYFCLKVPLENKRNFSIYLNKIIEKYI